MSRPSNVAATYDQERHQPPPGMNVPNVFGYIHFKAYKYLAIGPDQYRAQDALGKPDANSKPDALAILKHGCEQIVAWKGTTRGTALQGIGIPGFYNLMGLFHFGLVEQSVARIDGQMMDEMMMKHVMTGEQITFYNVP